MRMKCKHGSLGHAFLVESVAKEYLERGYCVVLDGMRTRFRRYSGLPRVDIIAENDSELVLIECGWLSTISRIRELKKLGFNGKHVKVVWIPNVFAIERQRSALDGW